MLQLYNMYTVFSWQNPFSMNVKTHNFTLVENQVDLFFYVIPNLRLLIVAVLILYSFFLFFYLTSMYITL